MLKRLHRFLEKFLETVGIAILVGLTLIVLGAVAARKLNISMAWYDEVASVMLAWLTYYGTALAALKRAHLGFSGLFLAVPVNVRGVLFVISEALVLGFFVLLGLKGFEILEVMGDETLVTVPWATLQMTQSVIPIGAALFVAAELLSMPAAWRRAFSGLDAEAEEIERAIEEATKDAEARS